MMSLGDRAGETAYAAPAGHGNECLEKVYENARVNRRRQVGLSIQQQQPIIVCDEDSSE